LGDSSIEVKVLNFFAPLRLCESELPFSGSLLSEVDTSFAAQGADQRRFVAFVLIAAEGAFPLLHCRLLVVLMDDGRVPVSLRPPRRSGSSGR
jgi:hypothetical protein